jgi:hypothetical protein
MVRYGASSGRSSESILRTWNIGTGFQPRMDDGRKFPIPNSKFQDASSPKFQHGARRTSWSLNLGISLELGTWILDFLISARQRRFHV